MYLWKRVGASQKLAIDQHELSERLRTTNATLSRLLGQMAAQGRITKINEGQHRKSTYRIVDPEVWEWYRP